MDYITLNGYSYLRKDLADTRCSNYPCTNDPKWTEKLEGNRMAKYCDHCMLGLVKEEMERITGIFDDLNNFIHEGDHPA